MTYKQLVKKNRIEILNKLGISSLEFNTETFNTLMLHFDGLISIWVNKRISVNDRRYKDMVLVRFENKGYRYCIGFLKEYDKCMLWGEEI